MDKKPVSVVPREAVATPEDVSKILHLTQEGIEELQREQKLALSRSRALLSDNDRRVARGIELERHYLITGDKNGLAEALKLQGRYWEAARAAKDPAIKAELTEMAMAVDKPDENCSCDDFKESDEYNLPQQYIEIRGYSEKHKSEITFIRCQECGDLNARPAPNHLLKQREVRNSNLSDKEKLTFFKK